MFSFLPDRITGCFYTVGTDGNNLHKFVMYEGVGGTFGSYIFEEVLGKWNEKVDESIYSE